MRVLVCGGTQGVLGGVERYCERFRESLGAHHSSIDVTYLPTNTSRAGVDRLLSHVSRMRDAARAIKREATRLDPGEDVIWLQYGNAFDALVLLRLRRWFRGRIVCTLHVGPQWRHMRSAVGRALAARALNRADVVCAISQDQVRRLARMGLSRTVRVDTLLPNWVNESPAPDEGAREGVLFVGRVEPEKGINDLLLAYSHVLHACPDVPLHIVGTGSPAYKHALRRLIGLRGMDSLVTWHGSRSEREVQGMMRKCAVLAYPSHADAYPLALLEGAAAGIPLVAYEIPGTSEILSAFGGHAVPLGDIEALGAAIVTALDVGADVDVVQRARRQYAWKAVTDQYTSVATGEAA